LDTLRIVLEKKNGAWIVASDPPNIILSTVNYPNIPKAILDAVNSL